MNVVFRVDASIQMGMGHMVRCLTLAEGLKQNHFNVSFLSQLLSGEHYRTVETRGFPIFNFPALNNDPLDQGRDGSASNAHRLEVDWQHDSDNAVIALSSMRPMPDWLIVDHYALDRRWEKSVRRFVKNLMVIDDLADRPHDCEILLDQTCTEDRHRYQDLLPEHCKQLLGGDYALLRPEFSALRSRTEFPKRFLNADRLHVFFGGGDTSGHTVRFSRLLLDFFPSLKLRIAVSASFRHLPQLIQLSERHGERVVWNQDVTNMAEHMSGCTIAVGTPGMTTWERACMGLPAAYLTNAENQVDILGSLQKSGFCEWLGRAETITDDAFIQGMTDFLNEKGKLARMRELGLAKVDGKGVERTVREISVRSA